MPRYGECMPVLGVHLVEGMHTPAQHAELLGAMSTRYADIAYVPLDQVRAYVTLHAPGLWATGGVSGARHEAPYFTVTLLADRPGALRRRLLASLTDVLVDVLGVERRLVHGQILPVDGDDWSVGGLSMGVARQDGVASR